MSWKVIGQSVIGSSHVQAGRGCDDAHHYQIIKTAGNDEALICFASDGAGSAKFAAQAAETSVRVAVELAGELFCDHESLNEENLLLLAEKAYDRLEQLAAKAEVPKNEFSCTLLGVILLPGKAGFLQIGDGAVIRNDGNNYFTHIFWPHNGEYQNSTAFLIDDPNMRHLKVKTVEEDIHEIGILTDGLQMLALNNETQTVHQPFFTNLFHWLRKANEPEHVSILNNKLADYLSGDIINSRTDDDKTLLLATKLK